MSLLRRSPLRRTGRLRPMSKKRQRQAKTYSLLRAAYLQAHPRCQALGLILLAGFQVPVRKGDTIPTATEIHHTAGRTGGNYLNTDTWLAVCRVAHDWIHANPREARSLGLLR